MLVNTFKKAISQLSGAFRTFNLTEASTEIWWEKLKTFPDDAVLHAIDQIIQNDNNAPNLGDVLRRCKDFTKGTSKRTSDTKASVWNWMQQELINGTAVILPNTHEGIEIYLPMAVEECMSIGNIVYREREYAGEIYPRFVIKVDFIKEVLGGGVLAEAMTEVVGEPVQQGFWAKLMSNPQWVPKYKQTRDRLALEALEVYSSTRKRAG